MGAGDPEFNTGGLDSNPTCNVAQLLHDNAINTIEPQLVNPASGDFRPVSGGNVTTNLTCAIPDFRWDDAPQHPPVPVGNLSNVILRNRDGATRTIPTYPGAY